MRKNHFSPNQVDDNLERSSNFFFPNEKKQDFEIKTWIFYMSVPLKLFKKYKIPFSQFYIAWVFGGTFGAYGAFLYCWTWKLEIFLHLNRFHTTKNSLVIEPFNLALQGSIKKIIYILSSCSQCKSLDNCDVIPICLEWGLLKIYLFSKLWRQT